MEWSGRRVAVVGLGVENTPLARFLARRGAQVTAFDRKPLEQLAPEARALADLGVRLAVGHDDLAALVEERFDAVFLTPGIVKDRPEIQAARQRGARITSQTNLFFSLCRAPIIGITGTSGKSTTTSLIGHILAADARRPVYVGGNLGQVLIEQVEAIPPDAWVVLELSSFQLELLEESPHIGVLLNLYPNHLDVHRTFEAYRAAKQRIYRFQRPERGDQAVFYYDDPALRTLSGEAPAGATFFGRSPDLPEGTTVTGDWAVIRRAARVTSVLPVSEIPLRGPHNVLNVLAAINVADLCQVPGERIREAVRSFRSLEHRLETVAEIDGVLFVNDSIATTPDRAAAALRSFDRPVVLIAGG
ncbi:MAG TPA: UDP-N-acetylmuramoyl-L-alanine--D-glutamate ligase, partial [Bacillota bacterium]